MIMKKIAAPEQKTTGAAKIKHLSMLLPSPFTQMKLNVRHIFILAQNVGIVKLRFRCPQAF